MITINGQYYTIDIEKLKEFLATNDKSQVIKKKKVLDGNGKLIKEVQNDDGIKYEIDGAKYDIWTNLLSYGGTISYDEDPEDEDNQLIFSNFTSVMLFNTFYELGIIKVQEEE
jgi:hypothetical protein